MNYPDTAHMPYRFRRNGQPSSRPDLPPQNLDAERAVLGCMLLDAQTIDDVADLLRPEHFYADAHQRIARTIYSMEDGIDVLTVAAQLERRGELADIGGPAYLAKLMEAPQLAAHARYYAELVVEKWRARDGMRAATRLASALSDPEADHDAALAEFAEARERIWRAHDEYLPQSIGDMIERHPTLRPPLIDGLLRRGETANIIAPSKAGKSWLSYGLALSIATGRRWLDHYQCTAGRVLIIDNELHPETLAHRIPAVADALSIRADEYREQIDVVTLRGRLVDVHGLARIVERVRPDQYAAVLLDALYRVIPRDTSENENGAMGRLYDRLDQYADRTAASWLLIHHSTKGSQSDKRVTDVGSGAGSQSRAPDTHLVLREHEDDGAVVLDAALRSWPPVEPLALRWTYPIWTAADDRDPAALRRQPTRRHERQAADDRDGIRLIVDAIREHGPSTARRLEDHTGMGDRRIKRLVAAMKRDGQLAARTVTIRGNQTSEYDTN